MAEITYRQSDPTDLGFRLDLNADETQTKAFDVRDMKNLVIQCDLESGSDSSFVATVYKSLDKANWYSIGTTINAAPAITNTLTVSGLAWVAVRITTANGAAGTARFTIFADDA